MSSASVTSASAVWFLVGPFGSEETVRHMPIYTFPFLIGRRQDVPLSLSCKTVSNVHAEIMQVGCSLLIRDLDSTNGTYVNGSRVQEPVVLAEHDLVQFANVPFRVHMQSNEDNPHTVQESADDRALALVLFDKLMSERAVAPFVQPIVDLKDRKIVAYEVLARSWLFGLETPESMFGVAHQLNLEVELSTMLRWEGVRVMQSMAQPPHLFLNTHPRELAKEEISHSLERLRENWPNQAMTLEIHEAAVTKGARLVQLRSLLQRLDIKLAYDDFGVGEWRLNDLSEVAPDYVKFGMSLIRDIDTATPQHQQVLATLVQMVHNLGITSSAKGVETAGEDETCRQMGIDRDQDGQHGVRSGIAQGE